MNEFRNLHPLAESSARHKQRSSKRQGRIRSIDLAYRPPPFTSAPRSRQPERKFAPVLRFPQVGGCLRGASRAGRAADDLLANPRSSYAGPRGESGRKITEIMKFDAVVAGSGLGGLAAGAPAHNVEATFALRCSPCRFGLSQGSFSDDFLRHSPPSADCRRRPFHDLRRR